MRVKLFGLVAILFISTAPAFGQIAVTDPPVETATALAATSLTTPGGAGLFRAQAPYLNSLMQLMTTGVADAQTFAGLYPGWVDFGPDAAGLAARITQSTLQSYSNAISVAQSQAGDFNAEDSQFAQLEGCNAQAAAMGVLAAIQCGNEIGLVEAQQTQMLRQLVITLIMLESTHYGEALNNTAQAGANLQASLLNAAQH
jgi:hypothetical protein